MKKNNYNCLYFIFLFICYNTAFSQQITIDNSIPANELIENHLATGCVEITNVNSPINGEVNGFSSFGAFDNNNTNFPLSNGIVISTGNAASGANTINTTDLSDGNMSWGTDPDIETALGVTNTANATVIEFDFVAVSDFIQFNYLMASEEYYANYPCNASDGFAFLIRESGSTTPYQNIALIPGSGAPVTVNNIHEEILNICPAANETYFEGYNNGNTNYNGRTTVMTAASNVQPNVQYHVKLIVADQGGDPEYDTAVFIETNTFSTLDLGDDITTCSSFAELNANINNPLATFQWYFNGSTTPIPNENGPSLMTSQSGTYKVEATIPVNNSTCVEEDDVLVTLNTETPINLVSDFNLCDDNGDGFETFDMTTKDVDVRSVIPFNNYEFSYHLSDADARSNSNPILTPIQNKSNPQPIYVRITDTGTNCNAYTTFNLTVNESPSITPPSNLEICDSDPNPDGFTSINLTQVNDEITGGNSNLAVSYHYSSDGALNGNSTINTSSYSNTNNPETVYVRVIDTQSGCVSTTTLTINVAVSPDVNRDRQYIDACDPDLDGHAFFDLTERENTILDGLTGVIVTYHENYNDAESGTNAISTPTNYEYTNAPQEPGFITIHARIEDDATGCATIVPLEIHTNALLTATDTSEFALCDYVGSNGYVGFNLNTVESFIANGLPFPIEVTYYDSQSDLENNNNPIDKGPLLPVSADEPRTLFIAIENTDTGCVEYEDIRLRVDPILLFNPPNPVPYCDTDDDGYMTFNLHEFDTEVTNGNANFTVTYFANETDAQNNYPQLPSSYTVNQTATVWARIENIASGCHSENEFTIEIQTAPTTNQPNPIIECDDDQDGVYKIDLKRVIPEVVSSTNGLDISFHTSYAYAEANTDPIQDPSSYDASSQTVYIRVIDTNSSSGCPAIVPLDIIINTLPDIPSISNYKICVEAGTTSADFLLYEKDNEILNGQPGKEVYYFEDSAFTTSLDKYTPYTSNGGQTIYVRVENSTDPNCNSTSSFQLEVASNPIYNTNFAKEFPPVCQTVNGDYTFDLETKRQEIAQGSPDDLIINFFLNSTDAQNNTGTPLPDQFTYSERQGQFYIRIEKSINSCAVTDEVSFLTFPTPHIISTNIAPVCDTDYDGSTTIDLTSATYNIENVRFSDVAISYFEDETLTTEITGSLVNNYPVNTSKTIYVKGEITQTGCYDVAPLELQVNLPPTINSVDTIPFCDNDTDTYDLTQVNPLLANDTGNLTITYHNNQSDANTGANSIGSTYNYTSSNPTLYARITQNTTGCFTTEAFNLLVNPNPIANMPQDLTACDDDFDGFLEFDLSDTAPEILGTQNPENFIITYYNSLINAMDAINALGNIHAAANGEIIYARLENSTTGCFDISQFTTYVNPLPVIPIEEEELLCLNDIPLTLSAETGNPGDTYRWDNGQTTPEIDFYSTDLGPHWVKVETPNGCSHIKNFTLVESEGANINFTTTVDFADPNSITVNVSGAGDYVYILDDGEPQTSHIFEYVSLGRHTVTIRDLNGCDDVTTEVFVIDIPKFFTPNNDDAFDTWHVVGIEQLPGTLVYIYNRYGKLLKTLTHTTVGWDGTFNGQNMPASDYWFVAKIIQDGNAFEMKGHFTLKR